MKRLAIRVISLAFLGVFSANTSCYGLAPELRTATDFKEFYTAVSICRTIEQKGSLDSNSYLNDILSRLETLKRNYRDLSITVLPHEVIIDIPDEGMAVRYFDPRNANVVTPFSNISQLCTKVINDRLCRQIIHRTRAIAQSGAASVYQPELSSSITKQQTDETLFPSKGIKSKIRPRAPPSLVEIEISNFCNLKCEICERGNPGYIQKPARHMSLDEFKKIIDFYDYPIERFQFCGTSEPTVNPHLVAMIKYLVEKKRPKRVELFTNGTLLAPSLSKDLLGAGLTMLWVSIDGSSEEIYQAIRHHRLAPVVENLKSFAKIAEGRIHIGVSCVITKSNIEDVRNMPKFVQDIGINELKFRIFETNTAKLDTLAAHDIKRLKEVSKEVEQESEKLGIKCNFVDFEERTAMRCNLVTQANISYEGYLTPCYHLPKLHMGHKLGDRPFSSHWNSPMITSIIKDVESGRLGKNCTCLRAIVAMRGASSGLCTVKTKELDKTQKERITVPLSVNKKVIAGAIELELLYHALINNPKISGNNEALQKLIAPSKRVGEPKEDLSAYFICGGKGENPVKERHIFFKGDGGKYVPLEKCKKYGLGTAYLAIHDNLKAESAEVDKEGVLWISFSEWKVGLKIIIEGTKNLLRLYCDAPTEEEQQALEDAVTRFINTYYYYVVDDADEVIGFVEPGLQHREPFPIHRAASVIVITNDGKIALQKRSYAIPHLKGRYDIIGGHSASDDESYKDKAIEELKWEFPITIEDASDRAQQTRVKPFKVRLPNNRENKGIYYIKLTDAESIQFKKANDELIEIWKEVFEEIRKDDDIIKKYGQLTTTEDIREKGREEEKNGMRWDGPTCKVAQKVFTRLIEEAKKSSDKDMEKLLTCAREVEQYETMPLDEAIYRYKKNQEEFADGFYALFDPDRNNAKEAETQKTIILSEIKNPRASAGGKAAKARAVISPETERIHVKNFRGAVNYIQDARIKEIAKNQTDYIDKNKTLFKNMLGEGKQDVLVRVPVEVIESMGIDNIKNLLVTFQGVPNGYAELYYMSGIEEINKSVYQQYGLQKKSLPKDFKRTRENTMTLFPALKGEEINQSAIVSRLGSIDITPENTILSPIGLQHDAAGLVRAIILGLRMMDIARQIKEKGIDITRDQAFKDKIQLEILEKLKNLCDVDDLKNFNLTPDDIIALATGTINHIIAALKKLIRLLPITPIDAEQLRQIYEHAKQALMAV